MMICRVINLNSERKTTKRAPATSFTSILDHTALLPNMKQLMSTISRLITTPIEDNKWNINKKIQIYK